jgi:hypothetical protein
LHVGDAHGHLCGQPATLWIALAATNVFVHAIHSFNDHANRLARGFVTNDSLHLSGLTAIIAGDDSHCVVYSNVHVRVSLACDPIAAILKRCCLERCFFV